MEFYFTNIEHFVVNGIVICNKNNADNKKDAICFELGKKYRAENLEDGFCISRTNVIQSIRSGLLSATPVIVEKTKKKDESVK